MTAFRDIPSVDELLTVLRSTITEHALPRPIVREVVRQYLNEVRAALARGERAAVAPLHDGQVLAQVVVPRVRRVLDGRYRRVVNGTGILLHTGLGRALLAERTVRALDRTTRYGLLELDPVSNERCRREQFVVDLLRDVTGSEDALVVNNNAGAVLLTLSCLARGREVVVSRGELVEIGGGFRVPEIMERGGARLKEVGTTNRTTLRDYEQALSSDVALILKVHPSNFRVVGFAASPERRELAQLARRARIPLVEDLGSGLLRAYTGIDLADEPTVKDAIDAGVDVVTFSGDKLLGGPQAGLLVGRKDLMRVLRADALFRALRPDKLQLVALEATLIEYQAAGDEAPDLPLFRQLREPLEHVQHRAQALASVLVMRVPAIDVSVVAATAQLGSGSVPGYDLASFALRVEVPSLSPDQLSQRLRECATPVFTRIHDGALLLDVRTLLPGDDELIAEALRTVTQTLREP